MMSAKVLLVSDHPETAQIWAYALGEMGSEVALAGSAEEALRQWAGCSSFEGDFKGRIRGLGFAVYQWLVMRQGVATIKPDVHVRRFVESIIHRSPTDGELVQALEEVARRLALKAYELDWRIWEYQKNAGR